MTLTYIRNGETLAFDRESCTGCGMCIEVCPHGVFRSEGSAAAVAHRERCMECGACARNCPAGAITVRTGVGCAAAILYGMLRRTAPSCGCSASQTCSGATSAQDPSQDQNNRS